MSLAKSAVERQGGACTDISAKTPIIVRGGEMDMLVPSMINDGQRTKTPPTAAAAAAAAAAAVVAIVYAKKGQPKMRFQITGFGGIWGGEVFFLQDWMANAHFVSHALVTSHCDT